MLEFMCRCEPHSVPGFLQRDEFLSLDSSLGIVLKYNTRTGRYRPPSAASLRALLLVANEETMLPRAAASGGDKCKSLKEVDEGTRPPPPRLSPAASAMPPLTVSTRVN
eukprot:GHVU01207998.1.p1 GENE.GHVU01207998.1~~GHVU01207998.1.p1  ORF type:complete len:109 (+),score=17.39 GHVU01207998.1:172-498(+)